MDVERWLADIRPGGCHRRQLSELTVTSTWGKKPAHRINWWSVFAHAVTFWAPPFILKFCGYRDKEMRQAFREKIALCIVIVLMCTSLGVFTFAMGPILCPSKAYARKVLWRDFNSDTGANRTIILGNLYQSDVLASALDLSALAISGQDLTDRLEVPSDSSCRRFFTPLVLNRCKDATGGCIKLETVESLATDQSLAFDWQDLKNSDELTEFDGIVVRLPKGLEIFQRPRMNEALQAVSGKDITRRLTRLPNSGARLRRCLAEYFKAGDLSRQTVGCFFYNLFQFIALLIIGSIIIIRFALAVAFSWFLSRKLDQMKARKTKDLHVRAASVSSKLPGIDKRPPEIVISTIRNSLKVDGISEFAQETVRFTEFDCDDPFVMLLVTCYSEGEASLRLTLDSLALTDYHDHRKLILIIADGQVVGSGNQKSTPEIAKDMMIIEESMVDAAQPKPYKAVASGEKSVNAATVYAGHYHCRGRLVPCVLVVKCGIPKEADSEKPGNRGKRDSQLILMNFMQRVLFNDRMAPLDFDLFNKIFWLMGVPPDVLEIVLMVDADTKVAVDSLGRMVNAMRRDALVMGLCGETRIANKRDSWVSAIQVFEYYISHHLGKSFESVFGGVTCLPGCFCMYRLKIRKEGKIIPILASPTIIEEYSQTEVKTLHAKNLLLLGEDRFLTTLMLKNFPKRKMIFVPQAYCKTFVPNEFRVLLSQRRRWINSTIHNLLELVLVPNLCGIFCFSMQFVVFMELIGTVVLPAAIVFTFVLIGMAIKDPLGALLPLVLLAVILGLPALLILITTRKLVYLWWMVVYLIALPVWNMILPLYAYWHFDDFSWGQTRKIEKSTSTLDPGGEDEIKDSDAIEDQHESKSDQITVPMQTWLAWSRHCQKEKGREQTQGYERGEEWEDD